MTASASEIARRDKTISGIFVEGFERMVDLVQHVPEGNAAAHRRALTIIGAEIGAIILSRCSPRRSSRLEPALPRGQVPLPAELAAGGADPSTGPA